MKRIKGLLKENYIIIISFFITLFLYFLILILNKNLSIETILYSDMYEQYSIFFNYVRECIFNNQGLFNSFSFSLGQNFYGILTYFCLSPLNIILFFSNSSNMPYFMLALVLMKFGLSASTMAYYLKQKYSNKKTIILFSMLYGLMAYNLTYYVNIMWLDCVYLLPLIILGLEKMIDKNKPLLYIISLTLAIYSNYYIAFSICIFLIIYFLYYVFLIRISKKVIFRKLLSFIKNSLIAVLLSAVVLIPTVFNMLDGKFSNSEASMSFSLNYNPLFLLYKFIVGDNKILLSDLPLLSSSLLVLLLTIFYFFNKKISNRDKTITFLTTTFLIIITLFPILDTIMHCFRIPNQFSYRYAFIISFFLIINAYKSFINKDTINKKNILLYVVLILLIFAYLKLYIAFKTIATCFLILLYFSAIIFLKDKKILIIIILPFFFMELAINITTTINEGTRITYDEYNHLLKYKDKIDVLKPSQNEFYRISGNRVTYNDSFNLQYYGVTSFSPTIGLNANKFLKDYLGLGLNESYAIEHVSSTEFTDSLLSLKYTYLVTEEDLIIKENSNYFPTFFTMNKNTKLSLETSKIENQNNLYKYLTNSNEDLFIEFDDYEIINCNINNNKLQLNESSYCDFKTKKDSSDYKYYIELKSDDYKLVPIYDYVETSEQYGTHFILDITEKGTIFSRDDIANLDYIESYKLDLTKLKELSNLLRNNQMEIKEHNNNYVRGEIKNNINKMMFTTIPYDEGWHVLINGKEVETYKNIDSLLAFDLPQGDAVVELYFVPKGFNLGLGISIITAIIGFIVYYRKKILIEQI